MKILSTILILLLVAALGGGAYFYLQVHQPMAADHEQLKQGQPEFDRMRKELARLKDKEKQETAWTSPVLDTLKKGLAGEISAGKAEVASSGSRIVVNISEGVLYTPQSVTFARDSKPALDNLASLLKDIRDKEIFIGNVTQAVPAQGKGRKRVPAKDARTLAAARSAELVKFLEKNGVPADSLIAASYPAKLPERGFRIKDKKTVIVIAAPAAVSPEALAPRPAPAAQSTPAVTAGAAAVKQEAKPAIAARSAPAVTTGAAAPKQEAKPAPAAAGTVAAQQPKSYPISTVPPKRTP